MQEQFSNPIIVESGFTYEEAVLFSHFSKNGAYDPITREPLKDMLGVKNHVLLAYISENNMRLAFNKDNLLDL
jgi:STIP1 family protein 1